MLKEQVQNSNFFSIGDFSLPHNASLQELPDATMSLFEETETKIDPETQAKYLAGVKGFLEGYGSQALRINDWVSAINSYDVATEGGLMQNQDVLGLLRKITQNNKTEGVDIAKAIQERLNRRNVGSPQPEHRSAPTAPPSAGPQP